VLDQRQSGHGAGDAPEAGVVAAWTKSGQRVIGTRTGESRLEHKSAGRLDGGCCRGQAGAVLTLSRLGRMARPTVIEDVLTSRKASRSRSRESKDSSTSGARHSGRLESGDIPAPDQR
jgi:hypothetical protein